MPCNAASTAWLRGTRPYAPVFASTATRRARRSPHPWHCRWISSRWGRSRRGALARQVETTIARPFDLERGPLLRVSLLRLAEDDHVLVLVQHHIVSDGWSMQVMVEELVQLYAAYSRGLEVALPALPIQYADYALWQRSWMEAGERSASWRTGPACWAASSRCWSCRSTGRARFGKAIVVPSSSWNWILICPRRSGAWPSRRGYCLRPVAGFVPGAAVSLQRAGGYPCRRADRQSQPRGDRAADRLLRQHPGAQGRPGRSDGLRRAAGPGPPTRAGGPGAPGPAVRATGGGLAAGAQS